MEQQGWHALPGRHDPGRVVSAAVGGSLLAALLLGCAPQYPDPPTLTRADQEPSLYAERAQQAEWTQDAAAANDGQDVLLFDGPRPNNLLIISIDTVRRDKVGRYGGGDLTPFLDSLLSKSVALDDFRSCSNWTYASMICALVGQSTVDLGFEPVGGKLDRSDEDEGNIVPEDLVGLPTWLREAGFATSLVSTTFFLSAESPTGNGFDTIVLEQDVPGERVVALATEAVQPLLAGEDPWYLHVHFRDPHFPFLPPPEYLLDLPDLENSGFTVTSQQGVDEILDVWETLTSQEQELVVAGFNWYYDGEIRYLDDQLAAFWADFEELGALEDTLVVFFTDHGEQFFEHGKLFHYEDLYEEESATVGGFWARNLIPTAYTGLTNHADLVPGIIRVLELSMPESVTGVTPGTGRSHHPRFTFTGPRANETKPINTVDLQGLRLYYRWDGELRLYDRLADPGEQEDIYGTRDAMQLERHLVDEVARNLEYVTWAEPVGLPH